MFDLSEHPHRRLNLLTGDWILVSPHRTKRPWRGQVEPESPNELPAYDPSCYLCPGNVRAGGFENPNYRTTYVFENDYAALLPGTPVGVESKNHFFQVAGESGICRVICFGPRHDLTLPEMAVDAVRHVVDVWATQVDELGQRSDIAYVQVFENKGEIMGCSNPHPHGQIWANNRLPNTPALEDAHQRHYMSQHGSVLLLDYLQAEIEDGSRIVVENEEWVALVPFWAVWPFELLLLPRAHVTALPALNDTQRQMLALILKQLLTRYDNLFEASFPYSMGWHGQPTEDGEYSHWQLHAHFYPPLLRSATVKKFMVGYELLAMAQRDITAEQAAARLRELSDVHYKMANRAG
jgi:UDPglucose--hexose-1-phosphate uridylyltransferase